MFEPIFIQVTRHLAKFKTAYKQPKSGIITSTATLDNFIQTEDETSVIIQEEWVQNFGGAEMIVGIV